MDNMNTVGRPDNAGNFAKTADQSPADGDQARGLQASAKDAASAITGQASSVAGQVKEKVFTVATGQKDGLAAYVDTLAQAVHKSGEQFAGQQDWLASAIERGATELGSIATSLRNNDVASLFGQARSVAQRRPGLFIGASLVAGFAVARLSKLVAAEVSSADLPTMPEVGHAQH